MRVCHVFASAVDAGGLPYGFWDVRWPIFLCGGGGGDAGGLPYGFWDVRWPIFLWGGGGGVRGGPAFLEIGVGFSMGFAGGLLMDDF